jgi:hypothetical protein
MIKQFKASFAALFVSFVSFCASPAGAATWNSYYGQGNLGDDPLFSQAGVPLSVITSVQSNSLYAITSAAVSGAARLRSILVKTDQTNATFKFYVATNTYTIASNAALATNILWITSTNQGIATNDLFVYRDVANDSYQLLIVSGNATDAGGLVYTNASGYNAIKFFTTPTNAPAAGDLLYQMRPQLTLTPCAETRVVANLTTAPAPMYQWLQLNDISPSWPLDLSAKVGLPSLSVLTISNAGGLFISGEYFKRPRL